MPAPDGQDRVVAVPEASLHCTSNNKMVVLVVLVVDLLTTRCLHGPDFGGCGEGLH